LVARALLSNWRPPESQPSEADGRCVLAQTLLDNLIPRIRGEYLEMPGLRLTPVQAQRLWGLTTAECEALMAALLDARFLRRTQDGSFILSDANSPASRSSERRPRAAGARELVLTPAALSGR
jgi:hypothetical protein